MRTAILIMTLLPLLLQCQPAQAQLERDQDITEYVSSLRRQIERAYEYRMFELKQRAESEIRLLDVADKCAEAVYADHPVLAAQAEVAKTVLHMSNYGHRVPWYLRAKTERMLELKGRLVPFGPTKPVGYGQNEPEKSAVRFAVAQTRVAERKNLILARLEREAIALEQQKQYALTIGLNDLQERLKQSALAPAPKPRPRVVTGIVYSTDKPSIIIDGNIVHEGQSVQGVKVLKIHKDRVEFDKQGQTWSQVVAAPANAAWSN